MSTSDFPLCRKLGFKVEPLGFEGHYISADDVEKLLSSAPVVFTHESQREWYCNPDQTLDTHTARLICIEELNQEPEEIRLLREIVSANSYSLDFKVYDRVRAFLAKRGEK